MKYTVYLRAAHTYAVHGDTIRRDRRGVTVVSANRKHFVPWDNVSFIVEERD